MKLKELNPDTEITVLYRDVRTYGLMEPYYANAREKGVLFARYEPEEKPEVKKDGQKLTVSYMDKIIRERMDVTPDLVVLSAATHARDNEDIASVLKLPRTLEGFSDLRTVHENGASQGQSVFTGFGRISLLCAQGPGIESEGLRAPAQQTHFRLIFGTQEPQVGLIAIGVPSPKGDFELDVVGDIRDRARPVGPVLHERPRIVQGAARIVDQLLQRRDVLGPVPPLLRIWPWLRR